MTTDRRFFAIVRQHNFNVCISKKRMHVCGEQRARIVTSAYTQHRMAIEGLVSVTTNLFNSRYTRRENLISKKRFENKPVITECAMTLSSSTITRFP